MWHRGYLSNGNMEEPVNDRLGPSFDWKTARNELARISHRLVVDLGESGRKKSVERPSFLWHNYVVETGYGCGKGGLSYDRV